MNIIISYFCVSKLGPNTIPRLLAGMQLTRTWSGLETLITTINNKINNC